MVVYCIKLSACHTLWLYITRGYEHFWMYYVHILYSSIHIKLVSVFFNVKEFRAVTHLYIFNYYGIKLTHGERYLQVKET